MLPPLAFIAAAVLLAVVPGPGMAYVVARTVAGGRSEGVASSLGTATGGMVHVVAAALGLSVLIAQSALAYSAVKYLGAGYLLFLGIKTLMKRTNGAQVPTLRRAGAGRAFRDGVVVEALNVKTAMFFLAFIPQFVSHAHPFALQFVLLGTLCVVFNTMADLIAVVAAHRFVASGVARGARERVLTMVSGATMTLLGLFVAL